MIVYFPEIYPDELVYSWFCRYFVHAGCLSSKDVFRDILRSRCNNPNKEFIGQLNLSAKELIETMYNMNDLILDHTMFPQYARFISPQRKKKAILRMKSECCDAHHLFAILPRSDGEQYMKYCPLCAEADRERYGETYWHRNHQIRNILICTKHGCFLEDSHIPAKSEKSFRLFPAEMSIEQRAARKSNCQELIGFAKYLEHVFSEPMDFDNDTLIRSILYNGLSSTKYMKSSGKSRYTKKLSEDLLVFYKNMGLHSIASMYQIQNTMVSDSDDFSVVCQIAYFIGIPIDELLHPKISCDQVQKERESHYMKNTLPVDWNRLDDEVSRALEEFCIRAINQSMNGTKRPERIGERLVYREMNLRGHQLENMPKSKAVFEKYTESYPECWARRIIWAYEKSKKENLDAKICWSDLREISGVKKKNIHLVIPYLKARTDDETAAEIVYIITADS